jgi:hypothetical protein
VPRLNDRNAAPRAGELLQSRQSRQGIAFQHVELGCATKRDGESCPSCKLATTVGALDDAIAQIRLASFKL